MVRLGFDVATHESVILTDKARSQGTYVIGTTGTGKTTLIQSIAVQDMFDPRRPSLIVLDPHGDLIDALLLRVPPWRQKDVVLFAPGERDQIERPLGLNLLDCDRTDPVARRIVVSTVVDTLRKLFSFSWGPRMEDLLRHAVLTLMEWEETSLLDVLLLLTSPLHRQRYTEDIEDPVLRHYWEVQVAGLSKRELAELVGSAQNKIGRFLVDPVIRNVVAQPSSDFDLADIMDNGEILLVNLSKGMLGEDNSRLLGAVLINLILIAALKRREQPKEARQPVHLIVDEYQNFATESFATLQSEARKYGIDLIVAHQYRDQLDDLNKGSTLNVANLIVMRVSGVDSVPLASQFDNTPPEPEPIMQPQYEPVSGEDGTVRGYHAAQGMHGTRYHEVPGPQRLYNDMQAERANQLSLLANYTARVRLLGDDGTMEERVMVVDPPNIQEIPAIAQAIRESSAANEPKEDIEQYIAETIGDTLDFDLPDGVELIEPNDSSM